MNPDAVKSVTEIGIDWNLLESGFFFLVALVPYTSAFIVLWKQRPTLFFKIGWEWWILLLCGFLGLAVYDFFCTNYDRMACAAAEILFLFFIAYFLQIVDEWAKDRATKTMSFPALGGSVEKFEEALNKSDNANRLVTIWIWMVGGALVYLLLCPPWIEVFGYGQSKIERRIGREWWWNLPETRHNFNVDTAQWFAFIVVTLLGGGAGIFFPIA